ncbi:MAG: NAD(P)/FAD-dependent oxidoreductase, partial [Microcystaceae cyanobacterium]
SWVLPMADNQLKIGAACFNAEHKIITQIKPLKEYIHLIFAEYMKLDQYKIIDVHGSIIKYSLGLQDIYYKGDNVIAIGDAVSTVNLLGGEGIRYAMQGAEIACKYLQDKLNTKIVDFQNYQVEMYHTFSRKWNLSEKISRRVYLEYSDREIDRGVTYLKYLKTDDIINILFYYQLEKFTKGLGGYLIKKLNSLIQFIKKFLASAIKL